MHWFCHLEVIICWLCYDIGNSVLHGILKQIIYYQSDFFCGLWCNSWSNGKIRISTSRNLLQAWVSGFVQSDKEDTCLHIECSWNSFNIHSRYCMHFLFRQQLITGIIAFYFTTTYWLAVCVLRQVWITVLHHEDKCSCPVLCCPAATAGIWWAEADIVTIDASGKCPVFSIFLHVWHHVFGVSNIKYCQLRHVHCHKQWTWPYTVDQENFAVKTISRSRPTAKIKHAKNKITVGDQWISLRASPHSPR